MLLLQSLHPPFPASYVVKIHTMATTRLLWYLADKQVYTGMYMLQHVLQTSLSGSSFSIVYYYSISSSSLPHLPISYLLFATAHQECIKGELVMPLTSKDPSDVHLGRDIHVS